VNSKLSEHGARSYYDNLKKNVRNVRNLQYESRTPGEMRKHCTITDNATNKMKLYLAVDSEFNDFDKSDKDNTCPRQKKDSQTPIKKAVADDYQNFKIAKYVKEKRRSMSEGSRYLNIIYRCY
jgi:hypothetical protein